MGSARGREGSSSHHCGPSPSCAVTYAEVNMAEHIDGQLEAFPAPLRAVTVTAYFEEGQGWHLTAMTRRQGGTYTPADHYSRLTRPELVDVLLETAFRLLELAD